MRNKLREKIAVRVGLDFSSGILRLTNTPLSGASPTLRMDIEAIDPKAWETLCYEVADDIIKTLDCDICPKMIPE